MSAADPAHAREPRGGPRARLVTDAKPRAEVRADAQAAKVTADVVGWLQANAR